MTSEIRRVPSNWKHPKDKDGCYIPLYGGSFGRNVAQWKKEKKQWEKGFYLSNSRWKLKSANMMYSFAYYAGKCPSKRFYMPDWPKDKRTHYQAYNTNTEGTPISPVMKTAEALAHWLADNSSSGYSCKEEAYRCWLRLIRRARFHM